MVLTVNNPSPDIDGAVRPGDNLYTDCIVALDLTTGKLRWYFQEVPHDLWDYDPISPPILVDVRDSSGKTVAAVAEAGKTGWVYVLDRATGKPIRRTDAFVPQQNVFASPTREGTLIAPGGNGGSEWSPAAVNPQLGYMYVLGLNEPDIYKLRPEKYKTGASWLSGVWLNALGANASGTFSAVDLNTGRVAWQEKMQHRMVGGALATAGGVVFVGSKERVFYAFDAQRGDTLWHYLAPAAVNAPPVTFAIDGRQYIAVAAGGVLQINSPRGDELLVFALPTPGDTSDRRDGEPGIGGGNHAVAAMRYASMVLAVIADRRLQRRRTGPSDPPTCGRAAARRSVPPGRPRVAARQRAAAKSDASLRYRRRRAARHAAAAARNTTIDDIRNGDALFHGKGGCVNCHGSEATGLAARGTSLTGGLHFIESGDLRGIDSIIVNGIADAETRSPIAMPPRGQHTNLTPTETHALAAYVWALATTRGEPWPGGHALHGPRDPNASARSSIP